MLQEVEGRVILSGAAAAPVPVVVAAKTRLVLTGKYAGELQKLQGVPLRLLGWRACGAAAGLGTPFDVVAYAPAGKGPARPGRLVIGVLIRADHEWVVADLGLARLFRVTGELPPGLTAAAGAKVALFLKEAEGVSDSSSVAAESFTVLAPDGGLAPPDR